VVGSAKLGRAACDDIEILRLVRVLAVVAVSGDSTVALLAVIAGLLYLVVRRYFSAPKTAGIATSHPRDAEFVICNSEKNGIADRQYIEVDVDINHRPAPHHFRLYSRFDLYSGRSEYEYKIDGTTVSIRLLNSRDDPSPASLRDLRRNSKL
jgi:hypothetical protein